MTWGPLTIDRHTLLKSQGVNLLVFVRGEDVTDRCQFADDTAGAQRAVLLRVDANGRAYLEEGLDSVAKEVAEDDIEIREVSA